MLLLVVPLCRVCVKGHSFGSQHFVMSQSDFDLRYHLMAVLFQTCVRCNKCLRWRLSTEGYLRCFLECCKLYWMIKHVRLCHLRDYGVNVKFFLRLMVPSFTSHIIFSCEIPSNSLHLLSMYIISLFLRSLHILPLSSCQTLLLAGWPTLSSPLLSAWSNQTVIPLTLHQPVPSALEKAVADTSMSKCMHEARALLWMWMYTSGAWAYLVFL